MKCRSLPIKVIQESGDKGPVTGGFKLQSQRLFRDFLLKWPDFIEFDELNSKIVTKHSEEETFRVWSL